MVRPLFPLMLIAILAVSGACDSSRSTASFSDSDEDARLNAAHTAVITFFQHVNARDCTALTPMFLDSATPEKCRRFLADMEHEQVRFLKTDSVYVDGRNKHAVIAKARMMTHRGEQVMLVRVEFVDGEWKLRL